MMERRSFSMLVVVMVLVSTAIVGIASPARGATASPTPTAPDYQATIAALQTQVAAPSGQRPNSVPTATSTPKPKKAKPFLSGNAFSLLHHGKKGEISVVGVGAYDGNELPLIVRNNTSDDVARIKISAVARSADGKLLASGGDQGFTPNVVHPGEYAIGYAYFSGAQLPADATFSFETSSTKAGDNKYETIRDLTVIEADYIDGRIVGFLQNGYKETVKGPMQVRAMCVGSDGALLGIFLNFTDKDSAASGDKVPFQVDIYNGVDCSNFLIAGSGFSF